MINKRLGQFMVSISFFLPVAALANGMAKSPLTSGAPTTIPFADNSQVRLTISNTDLNKLLVSRDKITNIHGPTGLYTAKNDAGGALYITTLAHRPFTLFLSTKSGHAASLFVTPKAITGKTIRLEPTTPIKTARHWEEGAAYVTRLTTLMDDMIAKRVPEDYTYSEIKRAKYTDFYGVASLRARALFSGDHLMGIVFSILNKTKHPITLQASSFYHHGVRAVALSKETLAPRATGFVYEIVGRG